MRSFWVACWQKGYSANNVQYVNDDGNVNYNWCSNDFGVRPFWYRRRNRVGETPKLESCNQKNRHPFLPENRKDKYKGVKYHDRK